MTHPGFFLHVLERSGRGKGVVFAAILSNRGRCGVSFCWWRGKAETGYRLASALHCIPILPDFSFVPDLIRKETKTRSCSSALIVSIDLRGVGVVTFHSSNLPRLPLTSDLTPPQAIEYLINQLPPPFNLFTHIPTTSNTQTPIQIHNPIHIPYTATSITSSHLPSNSIDMSGYGDDQQSVSPHFTSLPPHSLLIFLLHRAEATE